MIVKSLTQTCGACPSQWEGQSEAGDDIYIRYRRGFLRIEVNGKTILSGRIGDSLDGVLNEEDMKSVTSRILDWSKL